MKQFCFLCILAIIASSCSSTKNKAVKNGWIPLFDGKSLTNWKVNENPASFHVDSGMIIANGERSHLFYEGPVMNHDFKNFELKALVKTTKGSNSGIFIHTAFQETGWPSKGYEVQVNNTHSDWRKTGSLYAVEDVKEVYVKDGEWYTEYVKVEGKKITIKINDRTVVDYTEPEGIEKTADRATKHLSSGTFALQGHDPGSKVYFKEILVKPLP